LFNATEGLEICNEALQIFAGAGYTCQSPVERYLRDIRLLGIGGGTNEIMKYAIQRDLYKELKDR
jgi:alkylation response protein AidB-like acyl-CoA dehydrogenase